MSDASYGHAVTSRLAAMGIRDHPTAPRLAWQNGHSERLTGSIRRECPDHIVVFGEANLRRILAAYAGYYNEVWTHLSLSKDSPGHRSVQRYGQLVTGPILGGFIINIAGCSIKYAQPVKTQRPLDFGSFRSAINRRTDSLSRLGDPLGSPITAGISCRTC